MHNQLKLVGALSTQKIVLYAPLLKLYLNHRLKITAVHRPIGDVPQKAFKWFMEKVTENRRKGDQKSGGAGSPKNDSQDWFRKQ